jgi:hypothetical protein
VEPAASGSHWPMNYASYGERKIAGMWRIDVAAAGEPVDGFLSGYPRVSEQLSLALMCR